MSSRESNYFARLGRYSERLFVLPFSRFSIRTAPGDGIGGTDSDRFRSWGAEVGTNIRIVTSTGWWFRAKHALDTRGPFRAVGAARSPTRWPDAGSWSPGVVGDRPGRRDRSRCGRCDVLLLARREAELDEVVRTIEAHGGKASPTRATSTTPTRPTRRSLESWTSTPAWTFSSTTRAARSGGHSTSPTTGHTTSNDNAAQLLRCGAPDAGRTAGDAGASLRAGDQRTVGREPVRRTRLQRVRGAKAALDDVCASFQAETLSENVTFTSIYMPLVRTAMVAPNNQYLKAAALSPEEAGRSSATRSSTGRGGWARRWDADPVDRRDQHRARRRRPAPEVSRRAADRPLTTAASVRTACRPPSPGSPAAPWPPRSAQPSRREARRELEVMATSDGSTRWSVGSRSATNAGSSPIPAPASVAAVCA